MSGPVQQPRVVAIFGAQGTGKTTVAKWLFGCAMQRRARVKIVDPNNALGGVMPDDVEEWLDERFGRRDADLLVLDDLDGYCPSQLPAKSAWRQLAFRNRHLRVDVLFTARRPQGIPPAILSSVDVLYLFQTSAADLPGRKRIEEIAPGVRPPSRPFEFVEVWPKTATGIRPDLEKYGWTTHARGLTKPSGGVRWLPKGS